MFQESEVVNLVLALLVTGFFIFFPEGIVVRAFLFSISVFSVC